jgi:hypothetical protein
MDFDPKELLHMNRTQIERICCMYKITTEDVSNESLISQLQILHEFVLFTEPILTELIESESPQFRITPIKESHPLTLEIEDFKMQFSPKTQPIVEKPKEKENVIPKVVEKKLDQRIEEIKEKRKQFSSFTRNKITTDKRNEQLKKSDKLCRDNYKK